MDNFKSLNRIESISAFFALMPALDKQYTEVRLLNTGKGIVSGIFETTETGAAALDAELNRLHLNHRSVYATINQLDSEYVTAYLTKYKPNVLNVYAREVTKDANIGRLTLIMGLRRGEVLALTWSDIDFKTSTMRISKSLSRVGSEDFVSTTKTISGERVLKIPEFVVKALKDRRHTQWKQRIILQETYHDNDLVCCRQDGSYYVCGSFTSKFSDLLQKKGMRHIRFHDLRHTNATLLMQYHVPIKVVSQSLGHASTNVTLDTYSHVSMEMMEETADKLDEELFAEIG